MRAAFASEDVRTGRAADDLSECVPRALARTFGQVNVAPTYM
jgi:hypothetical protein